MPKQLTLVAYYGEKPPAVHALITALQEELVLQLGPAFHPYVIEQVHATIIGLEAVREGGDVLNLNFRDIRKERRPMNLSQILSFVDTTNRLPFDVQIGGFSPVTAYPFTSRNEHPYFRSFSLQGDKAVAMGWPVSDRGYPRHLDSLRKCLNDHNVLHKYHKSSSDLDNDFFFVLGRLEQSLLTECQVQDMQDILREKCSALGPVRITIDRGALTLAHYSDSQLPSGSTENIPLDMARPVLRALVREYPEGGT